MKAPGEKIVVVLTAAMTALLLARGEFMKALLLVAGFVFMKLIVSFMVRRIDRE